MHKRLSSTFTRFVHITFHWGRLSTEVKFFVVPKRERKWTVQSLTVDILDTNHKTGKFLQPHQVHNVLGSCQSKPRLKLNLIGHKLVSGTLHRREFCLCVAPCASFTFLWHAADIFIFSSVHIATFTELIGCYVSYLCHFVSRWTKPLPVPSLHLPSNTCLSLFCSIAVPVVAVPSALTAGCSWQP